MYFNTSHVYRVHAIQAIATYELHKNVMRHYWETLQFNVFLFNDFCLNGWSGGDRRQQMTGGSASYGSTRW